MIFFAVSQRAEKISPKLTLSARSVSAQSTVSLIRVSESSDMPTAYFLPDVTVNERPWFAPPVLFSSLTDRRFFLGRRDQTCPNCGASPCECEPYGITAYVAVICSSMLAAFSFFARRMALRTVPNLS